VFSRHSNIIYREVIELDAATDSANATTL